MAAAAAAQGGDAAAAAQGDAAQAAALAAAAQDDGASEAEEVEAPALKVLIDKAKSPLVASQMGASIPSMFQQMGVDVDVETIHEGSASDGDGAAANPMSGMVSLQLAIMPLFMVSMMTGLFLSRILGKKTDATSAERWKSIGIQAAYAVVASLIVSLCAFCMLLWIAGIEAPMDAIVPFMWLASFCVMLVFIGAFNISTALGGLLALVGFALGMMTGTFPFEALPAFWQDWVYPWAPQRFMSEGIRAILYLDAGAWNAGSLPLLIAVSYTHLDVYKRQVERQLRVVPQRVFAGGVRLVQHEPHGQFHEHAHDHGGGEELDPGADEGGAPGDQRRLERHQHERARCV